MKGMKQVMGMISIVLMAMLPGLSQAGSCDSATKVVSDLWSEYGGLVKTIDVVSEPAKIAEGMIKFWNQHVSSDKTWKKIGPVELTLNSTLKGNIFGKGTRMFIAATPLNDDEVELTIKKTDGKGKTNVTVCADDHGKKTKLWEFTIENGTDNVGKIWKKSLSGVKGSILTANFGGMSLTNNMKYEFTVNTN